MLPAPPPSPQRDVPRGEVQALQSPQAMRQRVLRIAGQEGQHHPGGFGAAPSAGPGAQQQQQQERSAAQRPHGGGQRRRAGTGRDSSTGWAPAPGPAPIGTPPPLPTPGDGSTDEGRGDAPRFVRRKGVLDIIFIFKTSRHHRAPQNPTGMTASFRATLPRPEDPTGASCISVCPPGLRTAKMVEAAGGRGSQLVHSRGARPQRGASPPRLSGCRPYGVCNVSALPATPRDFGPKMLVNPKAINAAQSGRGHVPPRKRPSAPTHSPNTQPQPIAQPTAPTHSHAGHPSPYGPRCSAWGSRCATKPRTHPALQPPVCCRRVPQLHPALLLARLKCA